MPSIVIAAMKAIVPIVETAIINKTSPLRSHQVSFSFGSRYASSTSTMASITDCRYLSLAAGRFIKARGHPAM